MHQVQYSLQDGQFDSYVGWVFLWLYERMPFEESGIRIDSQIDHRYHKESQTRCITGNILVEVFFCIPLIPVHMILHAQLHYRP